MRLTLLEAVFAGYISPIYAKSRRVFASAFCQHEADISRPFRAYVFVCFRSPHNQSLQRTRLSRFGCKRPVRCAGSLSSGVRRTAASARFEWVQPFAAPLAHSTVVVDGPPRHSHVDFVETLHLRTLRRSERRFSRALHVLRLFGCLVHDLSFLPAPSLDSALGRIRCCISSRNVLAWRTPLSSGKDEYQYPYSNPMRSRLP